MAIDRVGIERAAVALDKIGRHHGWWPESVPRWNEKDEVSAKEFFGFAEEIVNDPRNAADALDRIGRSQNWWPKSVPEWRDLDPIRGRKEFLSIVTDIVEASKDPVLQWIEKREKDWNSLPDNASVTLSAGEVKALLRNARDRYDLLVHLHTESSMQRHL